MAFTATYEDETATSTTFNPSEPVSEYIIEGAFTGTVRLQMSIPDATSWKDVDVVISEAGNVSVHNPINTPDALVDYRVVATGIVGTANFYFGP